MIINKEISNELLEAAGESRVLRAKAYIKKGKVSIIKSDYENPDNFSVTSIVEGNFDNYEVNIAVKDGELEVASCECEDYYNYFSCCKHIAATILKFEQTKYWDDNFNSEKDTKSTKIQKSKYRGINNLIDLFYNEELKEISEENKSVFSEKDKLKIEVKVNFDKYSSSLELEFKIGNSRMYKLKDLTEFYTRMLNNEFYKYGDKLEFVHLKENFGVDEQDLLEFILRYAEMMKNTHVTNRYGYYYSPSIDKTEITIGTNSIDEVFDLLKKRKVNFSGVLGGNEKLELIEHNPNIEFNLSKVNEEEFSLKPNIDIYNLNLFKGKTFDYVLIGNYFFRCDKDFSNSNLKMIKSFRENYTEEMLLSKDNLKEFFSIVAPKIENYIKYQDIDLEEIEKIKPEKLAVKTFLDFDENSNLTCDVKFCYGDEEFNPFEEKININTLRNPIEEQRNIAIFNKSGFLLDTKNSRLILINDDEIYTFLTDQINLFMQKFEVMVTENFKSKEIKQPKIGTIGVRVENNLLNIDLSKINISPEEIAEVMKKYKLKKKFHRLKDGSFLNLAENEDVEFIDKLTSGMDINFKDIKNNTIKLPVNRTLYLNELLKKFKNTKASKDDEFKQITQDLEKENLNEDIEIPDNLNATLRDYQKTGFNWLKTLENYKFGGILADDMGLGKTIQLLSVILSYINEAQSKKMPSIVISPSSLALNWFAESKKFSPSLNVKVISGKANERNTIISEIEKYDLVITSYDLLKRDIEKYIEKDITFKYIIADEAQYLKNSNTQNAKAIKELKGEVRFGLTGTPIENSLAELWSIFDFIMPGYLFQYKKFKTLYETPIVKDNDERAMAKLKMLIEPFVLRRTKKEVLTELPEKTISVLENTMTEEQEKIYMSYLAKAKQEVADQIKINGFEKSQIMILAALTRLRQICCHPGLFISDYKGESSKLSQCMEIIEEGINAGHKILLFSGYTSMFDIIQKELSSRNINYYKLTGSTKVSERIKMVDEFNSDPDIKVFLISLKAGGTGLNLTGADMVIHYDPWWNSSAENQATDRAYRIGQKNNVQVYKLITSNSIEEKIYELQQKKSELIDNMLSTKTSFISKFSREEIMNLFE